MVEVDHANLWQGNVRKVMRLNAKNSVIFAILSLMITGCYTGDPNTRDGCYQHARVDGGICGLGCPIYPYENAQAAAMASQCRSQCDQNRLAALSRCDQLPR
jgi:hypothetical protein